MNIIAFLIVGLVAGWLAGILVEGHGFGAISDMVLGVVGAFVGGFVFDVLGIHTYGLWGAIAMSAVGAIACLAIIRIFSGSARAFKPVGK